VRGLAGGVSEWTRDVAARYDAPCWSARSSWLDPVCEGGGNEAHVVRGGGWGGTPIAVRSVARFSSASQTSLVGFRCAYGNAR
jgi:formylglycine-generating enzyme required for sulfatase activity